MEEILKKKAHEKVSFNLKVLLTAIQESWSHFDKKTKKQQQNIALNL